MSDQSSGSGESSSPEKSSGSGKSSGPETVCPLCAVGCHLEPGADTSRAKGVAGPANPNGRLCRKGIGAFEIVDDDRLTEPMIRRGGDTYTVSWSAAYDHVVERFEAILETDGPDALAFLGAPHCTTEENYLLQKLARTLGTNDVDNRARLCHAGTARALSERIGWPATTNGLDDLGDADVILVAGANPAERQPVAFDSVVRPAVNDGTTLVHVDPVGNETTRLADVHLAPRPGTDAVVFDLLSALVLDADGVDREFVGKRTRGFETVERRLADLDRERAASITDVDHDALDRVADLLVGESRVAALTGTGIDGIDGEDGDAPDALLDLLLLTGNLGRRGTGLFVLRGLVNEQGATDAGCVPDRLPGHQSVTDAAARDRVATEWGVEPPADPGRPATDLLSAFGDDIRGALVVGENPAISKRDAGWIHDRLDALDTLVVLDIVPSGTTEQADVVLPATAGVEKNGTVTNLDRRIQRLTRTTSPPGEARPDFEIVRDLGRRLLDETDRLDDGTTCFDYDEVGEVFDELARVAPTHTGISYDGIECAGRRWPADEGGVLYREAFETADGRAAFGTPRSVIGPEERREKGGLHLVAGGRASEFYGGHGESNRTLRMHPADAAERGIDATTSVVVSNGDTTVTASVALDDDIRRGTVYLPASTADPFLRCEESSVTVEPRTDDERPD